MRRAMTGLALFAATLLAGTTAHAQDTIKIAVIMSYSGQFADTGTQINNGIKLYMKEHGDKVAGKKIELIAKDLVFAEKPVGGRRRLVQLDPSP